MAEREEKKEGGSMTTGHKVQIAIFGLLYIGVSWAVWSELRNWWANAHRNSAQEAKERLQAAIEQDRDLEGAA